MGLYGSSDSSSVIEAQQQAQQNAITQGQADISSVFSGGKGVDPIAGNPVGAVYYDQYGAQVTDPSAYAPGTTFYAGTSSTGGFDQGFYNNVAQSYEDYALPKYQQQLQQTTNATTYDLARSGLMNSGAADYLSQQLGLEKEGQLQNIANQGLSQAQTVEANVNQEQNTLLNQLQASANPTQAAQGATEAAQQFSQPTAFPALGQLFSNFSNTYLKGNLASAYGQVGTSQYEPTYFGFGQSGVGAPLGSSFSLS